MIGISEYSRKIWSGGEVRQTHPYGRRHWEALAVEISPTSQARNICVLSRLATTALCLSFSALLHQCLYHVFILFLPSGTSRQRALTVRWRSWHGMSLSSQPNSMYWKKDNQWSDQLLPPQNHCPLTDASCTGSERLYEACRSPFCY